MEIYRWNISVGIFLVRIFFSMYFLFIKPSVFLLTKLAINIKILTNGISIDFFLMN